ncbi:class F sortase [Nocardioides massiliensis]|uniref:LPXTG-site transpeptidase (Sortase) family protein n=1 Tax=Nocardioides massiliensis TaxID=1325935 RepID=A0ABT9NQL4_9ACTN|nr:class F sortase [Nocardioides massiliensis]MDP9822110.1 LPXTG-site transpeptidase (sortase) family protein [Nocardioides massiliensis]
MSSRETDGQQPRSLPAIIAGLALVLLAAGFLWPSIPGVGGGDDSSEEPAVALPAAADSDLLEIPSIQLDAPIDPIEVDPAGVLTPPADVQRVGWWQRSAEPGARAGQTVITGHTVHTGGGVMNRLKKVRRGAEVLVHSDGEVAKYAVLRVHKLSREEVSARAEELFGQDRDDGRLVLVTCEDWVNGDYQSNVVVFAERLASSTDV